MGEAASELNILVIEDDASLRRLLSEVVAKRGHQVVSAASAEEGLEYLPNWTFHVALLDHNLPGMEGLLLGEYLRRTNPDMMIAMITGTDDPRVERKSREHSLRFIAKPFEVEQVLRVIDEYIEAARERDEKRKDGEATDYEAPLARFADELPDCFGIPNVPSRIEERVVDAIKRSLNNLRSASRYTKRERVIALSGLITARVLGIGLPNVSSGRTMFEEYDHLMRERGRRTVFDR